MQLAITFACPVLYLNDVHFVVLHTCSTDVRFEFFVLQLNSLLIFGIP